MSGRSVSEIIGDACAEQLQCSTRDRLTDPRRSIETIFNDMISRIEESEEPRKRTRPGRGRSAKRRYKAVSILSEVQEAMC